MSSDILILHSDGHIQSANMGLYVVKGSRKQYNFTPNTTNESEIKKLLVKYNGLMKEQDKLVKQLKVNFDARKKKKDDNKLINEHVKLTIQIRVISEQIQQNQFKRKYLHLAKYDLTISKGKKTAPSKVDFKNQNNTQTV